MEKYISNKIKMKSSARLAVVQAAYMIEFGDLSVDEVIKDFIDGKVGRFALSEATNYQKEEQLELNEIDTNYFATLTRGVMSKKEDVEKSLSLFLKEDWSYEKMDGTLRALLLCAVYELIYTTDVDAKILIKEYVDLAYAFFSKSEPKVVNALLDQIAKEVR